MKGEATSGIEKGGKSRALGEGISLLFFCEKRKTRDVGIVMIQVQLKNLEDFKRLVNSQSIVFVKESTDGFIYYVILKQSEVETINVFKSKNPLMLIEDFNPDEREGIFVGSLLEIESISVHGRVLHE